MTIYITLVERELMSREVEYVGSDRDAAEEAARGAFAEILRKHMIFEIQTWDNGELLNVDVSSITE